MKYMILQQWLHFSVVYEDSTPGKRYFDELKANVVDFEMCIVSSRLVAIETNFISILENLMNKDNVYVTVFLGDSPDILLKITEATAQLKAQGKIMWITVGHLYKFLDAETIVPGSLIVTFTQRREEGFTRYLQSINARTTNNPWFLKAFEDIFECPDDTCINTKQRDPKLYGLSEGAHVQDAVYAYALALNEMLGEQCLNLEGEEAVRCYTKHFKLFQKYLRSIHFFGMTGAIDFKPDFIKSDYVYIFQDRGKETKKSFKLLSIYDSEFKLTTVIANVSWEYFTFPKANLDIYVHCRPVCGPHHFKHKGESCCWTCHKCQDNEIISDTGAICDACPPLHWPLDNNTKVTECVPITPETFNWLSVTPVSFYAFAGLGIVIVLFVIVFYKVYRANILIKSSNLQLSVIQLVSIVWGYVAVPLLINHNSSICCNVGIFLFNISFYALYATMLIKALKLYKIFNFTVTENNSKNFPRKTYLISFWLFFLTLVVTLLFLHVNFPLATSISQPDLSVQYAEIACNVPLPYIIALLAVAISLLLITFIISFMTASIPNTFRETRFVNTCSLITLVMWLAFMPSYFTATRAQMKMYFIAIMVLLNHGLAILFLFLPRIATILYLGESVRKLSSVRDDLDLYFVQPPNELKHMSIEEVKSDKKLNFKRISIVQEPPVNDSLFESTPFPSSTHLNKAIESLVTFAQVCSPVKSAPQVEEEKCSTVL